MTDKLPGCWWGGRGLWFLLPFTPREQGCRNIWCPGDTRRKRCMLWDIGLVCNNRWIGSHWPKFRGSLQVLTLTLPQAAQGGEEGGWLWFVWLDRGWKRKAHDSAEQRDGVTEGPWRWWKIGSTDTNNVRSDKNVKNYRSKLNRVISVTLMLILADCFKTGKLSCTHQ